MSQSDDQAASMRTLITRGIRKALGLHEQFASQAADAAYEEMRQHFAGEEIYFRRRDPRWREHVLADFNGRNHDEVCRRHRISRRTLERYISG